MTLGGLRNTGHVAFRISGAEPVRALGRPMIDDVRVWSVPGGFGLSRAYDRGRTYSWRRLAEASRRPIRPGQATGVVIRFHGGGTDRYTAIVGVRLRLRTDTGETGSVVFPVGGLTCPARCRTEGDRLFHELEDLGR